MPERSRRVRKVSPACARRSATHPQSRTLRPASPAPSSPHSASLGGHCSGCSLSTFSPAAAGASSAGFAAASVAAAAARVRSWGAGPEGAGAAEAEVVESGRRRRRCKADGLGFRRERRARGEARSREDAIGDGEGADWGEWGFGLEEERGALSSAPFLQNALQVEDRKHAVIVKIFSTN